MFRVRGWKDQELTNKYLLQLPVLFTVLRYGWMLADYILINKDD